MNQEVNNNQSWEASLSNADPFLDGPNDLDNTTKKKIFQEIAMKQEQATNGHSQADRETPDLVKRAAAQHKQPSRLLRPLMAVSAAAAVLVAVVLGVSLIRPESASAQMLTAAQESVTASEGQISVSAELQAVAVEGGDTEAGLVDGVEVDGVEVDGVENVSGTLEFDFDGDDYAFIASIEDGSEGFNPQASYVDGDLFASENGEDWVSLGAEDSAGFAQLATQVIPGVQNFDGTALEQLVLLTDDITKTEEDGVVSYVGNVQTEEVLALSAAKLPAALIPFRLADQGDMPLPPELGVEMTIVDGKATIVTIKVEEYEVDGVVVNGSVTTDYTKVGEPQTITAPPESRVQSMEDFEINGAEFGE